jgi:mycothiol synthase
LCRDDDRLSRGIYESNGFLLDDEELRMARPLDEPIPESRLPTGFTIRALSGHEEVAAWVALYQEAFAGMTHSERWTTVDRRLAIMRDPDYEPALDLVADGPDGALAGFCYCSIGSAEAAANPSNAARIEPIATRSPYRGLGLGRAIVLEGLRRLRDRGMDEVGLTVDTSNAPAQRLYASVGFRPAYRALWYARDL